jgi:hypothetical protein
MNSSILKGGNMSNRIGYYESYNFGQVKNMIGRGSIQVPEFLSNQFSWREDEIICLLDHFYSGTYRANILVIDAGMRYSGSSIGSLQRTQTLTIPSRRLSRNISKTGIKFPNCKPVSDFQSIYYILDGYHQLQSLYLAWHGLLDGKHAYFDTCATDGDRFSFLKPSNINITRHARLATVRRISVPDLPLIDQVNINCQQFREVFHESKRISFDVIDIDDPFFDRQDWVKNDKYPDLKIVADRIQFIK